MIDMIGRYPVVTIEAVVPVGLDRPGMWVTLTVGSVRPMTCETAASLISIVRVLLDARIPACARTCYNYARTGT